MQSQSKPFADITVVLTIWKRNNLHEQIGCILSQTIRPREIIIVQCCNFVKLSFPDVESLGVELKYVYSSYDFGYFFRFTIANHAKSEYIYIMDDDIIPTKNWLDYIYGICRKEHVIVTSSGRIIPSGNYYPEKESNAEYLNKFFVGDGSDLQYNFNNKDRLVDFGCNSWFFKKEWLYSLWNIPPFTLSTGEDIHFSAVLSMVNKTKTLVPRQTNRCNGNTKKIYGYDSSASWKRKNFLKDRSKILHHLIDTLGWKPILWENK